MSKELSFVSLWWSICSVKNVLSVTYVVVVLVGMPCVAFAGMTADDLLPVFLVTPVAAAGAAILAKMSISSFLSSQVAEPQRHFYIVVGLIEWLAVAAGIAILLVTWWSEARTDHSLIHTELICWLRVTAMWMAVVFPANFVGLRLNGRGPRRGLGHTVLLAFVFSLPALVIFWLFVKLFW